MDKLNFEEINKELEALDLDQLEEIILPKIMNRKMTLSDICDLWKNIRVIIYILADSRVLHPKYKRALQLLYRTMERTC